MNFLANENFPYPSIKILRDEGFYVKSIGEDLGGISDESVMELAVRENLIILTFDRDYGELIFKFQKESPPSVVYFRLKGDSPEIAANLLLRLMKDGLTIENHFTVIESTGTRQRKLR
jgi:predicted nuclease of predicted toxin-antitoxin system